MDARQRERSNPFGMDESCENCQALCETRTQVVHGYGDVGADFLFVGHHPSDAADRVGVPFAGNETFYDVLRRVMLCRAPVDYERPELHNTYVTALTRCRDPDREPTDEEVLNCEPFLEAEIRMINPEVIVPVGQRALTEIAREYTTTDAADLDVREHHATSVRGRGFELVPMRHPDDQTDADTQAFVEFFSELLASDYRQTKGRRGR